MIDKSSEAYGEKGYKWGNHLFYTPGLTKYSKEETCTLFSICAAAEKMTQKLKQAF
jgi:hypothetical protein